MFWEQRISKKPWKLFLLLSIIGTLSGCCCLGRAHRYERVQYGYASYYGPNFNGRRTASGEIFNMYDYTAAHRYFPFGTIVEVTNLENGRNVVVRINDRGPYKAGRIIDLSYAAAKKLGMIGKGVVKVKLRVIKWGKRK